MSCVYVLQFFNSKGEEKLMVVFDNWVHAKQEGENSLIRELKSSGKWNKTEKVEEQIKTTKNGVIWTLKTNYSPYALVSKKFVHKKFPYFDTDGR